MKNITLTALLSVLVFISANAQYWQHCSGPGGSIPSMTVDVQNNCFAATWGSGIYLSSDNGGTWTQVNNGLTDLFISSVRVNENGVLYTTGFDGIFRSADHGASWTAINNGLLNPVTNAVAFDTGARIFAANTLGLYRSDDNGDSWSPVTSYVQTPENSINSIAVNTLSYIYLGTAGEGIYFSTDGGNSWQQRDIGSNKPVTCIYVEDNGMLLATSCDNGSETGDGIFISTDNGNTWSTLNNGLGELAVLSVIQFSGEELFAGTYHQGIFHSTDNGNTWEQFNDGLNATNVGSFAKSMDGFIYSGTNNGVFRSILAATVPFISPVDWFELLNQNSPNPFQDETEIAYAVPAAFSGMRVQLFVIDALGKRVATLVDGTGSAGKYTITFFTPAQMASGTYYCELIIGSYAERKKMIHFNR